MCFDYTCQLSAAVTFVTDRGDRPVKRARDVEMVFLTAGDGGDEEEAEEDTQGLFQEIGLFGLGYALDHAAGNVSPRTLELRYQSAGAGALL